MTDIRVERGGVVEDNAVTVELQVLRAAHVDDAAEG
ncbi:hypothetical protein PS627_01515 [Pseudomonas fluorescens]|nr:hypothetical protein PS627_01515 [Pseudomonas fluorescens]VVP86543.1 hypothetical protein PS910_02462 [Pseudomonas fluorescens]